MSKQAQGKIVGTNGTRFTGAFLLPDNGIQFDFSGNFSSPVPAFSASVTLTYDNITQLTATRRFDGQLGEKNIKLTISNGPVISGALDKPVSPALSVSGSYVWLLN